MKDRLAKIPTEPECSMLWNGKRTSEHDRASAAHTASPCSHRSTTDLRVDFWEGVDDGVELICHLYQDYQKVYIIYVSYT